MPAAGSTPTIGDDEDPKSISHEHTFNRGHRRLERHWKSTLTRLSEMVGRRLREHGLHARTVQLKLRYKDFTTITRARTRWLSPLNSTPKSTSEVRTLFRKNWKQGKAVRLLGVQASSFERRRAR